MYCICEMVDLLLKSALLTSLHHRHLIEFLHKCISLYLFPDNTNFVERCPQNRTFINKGLSVRPLEVTKQVVVEDIPNVDEEMVRLYFENEGGDVEDVVFNDEEQSAVITFKNHQGSSLTLQITV